MLPKLFRRLPKPRKAAAPMTMASRIEDPRVLQRVEASFIDLTQNIDTIIAYRDECLAYRDQLNLTIEGLNNHLDTLCRAGALQTRTQGVLRAISITDSLEASRASSTPPSASTGQLAMRASSKA